MPWCEDCSKFWNPPELDGGSRCPRCGEVLSVPRAALVDLVAGPEVAGAGPAGEPGRPAKASRAGVAVPGGVRPSEHGDVAPSAGALGAEAGQAGAGAGAKGAPWHFKLLVVGVAGYMVYRIIWFIEWLPKHI